MKLLLQRKLTGIHDNSRGWHTTIQIETHFTSHTFTAHGDITSTDGPDRAGSERASVRGRWRHTHYQLLDNLRAMSHVWQQYRGGSGLAAGETRRLWSALIAARSAPAVSDWVTKTAWALLASAVSCSRESQLISWSPWSKLNFTRIWGSQTVVLLWSCPFALSALCHSLTSRPVALHWILNVKSNKSLAVGL